MWRCTHYSYFFVDKKVAGISNNKGAFILFFTRYFNPNHQSIAVSGTCFSLLSSVEIVSEKNGSGMQIKLCCCLSRVE